MTHSHTHGENVVVLVAEQRGMTIIPSPTPLTSLNYFDGKFLRAADLDTEKRYVRRLVEISNQGLGAGVVHGLDTTLSAGDAIHVGPGLAIDPLGRVLLLPAAAQVAVEELLEASRRASSPMALDERRVKALAASSVAAGLKPGAPMAPTFEDCEDVVETPPSGVVAATDLYLISIGHAEALCGHEDVFGRLCDEGCVTRSDRPFRVEGIVIRAIPLVLRSALVDSGIIAVDRRHLRSRVASAYFADDATRVGSLISRAGLAADTWCLGARLESGSDVPLAVLARSGGTTTFLDAWIARRERIEAPARRYWARRMAMRPWDTFLAQILQFQCQLHDLLGTTTEPGGDDDPCRPQHTVLDEAARALEDIESHYAKLLATTVPGVPEIDASGAPVGIASLPGGLARLALLRGRIRTALEGAFSAPTSRVLIGSGIVELPPAGYLPVVPGSGLTVNEQVRRLVGEGLDLRFCVVRPDFVPHALEEAQHMERISLLAGLDHPEARPRVDVLVPDGEIEKRTVTPTGMGFEMTVRLHLGPPAPGPIEGPDALRRVRATAPPSSALEVRGAGRGEILPNGRMAFHMAGATEARRTARPVDLIRALMRREVGGVPAADVLKDIPTFAEAEHDTDFARSTLGNRVRSMSGVAETFLRSVRIAEAPFVASAVPAAIDRFGVSLAPNERRVVALWASMSIDTDLRSIEPGGNAGLYFDAAFVSPSKLATTQRGTWRGELRVDQVAETPQGRRISGVATLSVTHQEIENGVIGAVDVEEVKARVAIDLALSPAGVSSLTVHMRPMRPISDRGRSYIIASWAFGPMTANVRFGSVVNGVERDLVDVDALENAGVLVPGHELHSIAWSAIDIIAAAFADTGFVDAARRALFPPPPKPHSDLVVRATRDWVLFHRRRDITCDVEAEAPVVAPPRRYAVFQRFVKDGPEADAIRLALLNGESDAITRAELRRVDEVDYPGGQALLLTPADSIRQDWSATGPGDRILYSYLASTAPGDGDVLARARLARLLDVLAPVTPPVASALADVVVGVPTALAIPGYDGVIVELTIDVATTCARVFRLEHDGRGDDFDVSVVNGSALVKLGENSRMVPLGEIRFPNDQADFAGGQDEVLQRWTDNGAGPSDRILVISGKGDDSAGSATLRIDRGAAVGTLLHVAPREVRPIETGDFLTDGCSTTIVVVARPPEVALECVEVHVVDGAGFERIKSAQSNKEVQTILAALGKHLGDGQFAAAASSFTTMPTDIRDAWAGTGHDFVEVTWLFSQLGDPRAGDADLRSRRAKAIFAATGIPSSGLKDVQPTDPISGPCATLMVVFAPVSIATECHDLWLVRSQDVFERLRIVPTMAGVEGLLKSVPVEAAEFLESTRFIAGTADLSGDPANLEKGFLEAGGETPAAAIVFTLMTQFGGNPGLQEERGLMIQKVIGAGEEHEVRTFDAPPSDDCQAITVLFHRP
jgi:hypothetical protein